MKYCHQCRQHLELGIEKFCPACGFDLKNPTSAKNNNGRFNSINISETASDVIGTGVSGDKNVIGKGVGYTTHGHVFVLQFSEQVSNRDIEKMKELISMSTQLEPSAEGLTNEHYEEKSEQAIIARKQILNILEETDRVERKTGKEIKEITAENLHISKKELSVKELLLKGNEHFYKKEYENAIEWYNKVIHMDESVFDAWFNKGYALVNLGRIDEASECYDRALELNSDDTFAFNQKSWALYKTGKLENILEHFDNLLKENPANADLWSHKGSHLGTASRYEEAIDCFDRALEINPNNYSDWYSKGTALKYLGKDDEAYRLL